MSKALFLSALVFPGAGQLYLQRYKSGVVLLVTIIMCIFTMVASVLNTAMSAMQEIQISGGIVDMSQISRIATETAENASNNGFTLALILIIACWLYSIVDVVLACQNSTTTT